MITFKQYRKMFGIETITDEEFADAHRRYMAERDRLEEGAEPVDIKIKPKPRRKISRNINANPYRKKAYGHQARALMKTETHGGRCDDLVDYIEDMLRREPRVCYLCGRSGLSLRESTVDHIVPLSEGGDHSEDNVALACEPCNTDKWNNSLLSYLVKRLNGERTSPFRRDVT